MKFDEKVQQILSEGPKNDIIKKLAQMFANDKNYSDAHYKMAEKKYSNLFDLFSEEGLPVESGGILDTLATQLGIISADGSKNLKDGKKVIHDFVRQNKLDKDLEKKIYVTWFA